MGIMEELGVPTSPPTGGTQPSFAPLEGSPESEEGILMQALGLFERPARAVSEVVGELREDDPGSVLDALLRGLKGEYEHASLGEQLIPEDPDDVFEDSVMKNISRFAVDMAADPLMYLGALPARAAIGAGLRGATKVAKLIPYPQGLARWTLPMTHVFKKWGGTAGYRVAKGLERAYNNHKYATGRVEFEFLELVKQLGLGGKKGEPYMKAADDLLRGIDDVSEFHMDPRTQEIAAFLRNKLDNAAERIGGYVDPKGLKFQVIEPMLDQAKKDVYTRMRKWKGGLLGKNKRAWRDQVWKAWTVGDDLPTENRAAAERLMGLFDEKLKPLGYQWSEGMPSIFKKGFNKLPWKKREWYAPQMLNQAAQEAIYGKPAKGYHKAVRSFAKQLGVDEEKALDILRNMGMPKRAGNIEYARHIPFNAELFEKNPLIWFPKYINRMEERIAYADEFGLNGQILNSLYRTMKGDAKSTLDRKWMADARDIILGKYKTETAISNLAQKVMGMQVVTKMGFLSTLSNLSQNSNTIIREGGTNFLKGIFRGMTKEGQRQGYIAYQRSVQEALEQLAGGKAHWAQRYLNYTGFTPMERFNRWMGANAGILRTEQLIQQEGKLTRELVRRGLSEADMTPELVQTIKNGGHLPMELADKVGFLASEATQHATHWKDLPIGWQDPMMRVATQYKNFVYQQTRFLLRDVLKPAKTYFESNGKKGSITPLMRAFVTFGISAELVGKARSEVREWGARLPELWGSEPLDYKERERRDDWVIQLLEDGLHVGALGIAGDLVDRATWRDLDSWLIGPTFADITGLTEAIVEAGGRVHEGKEIPYEQYMAQLMRRIPYAPGVAPSPKALQEPASEILSLLGVR